MKDYPYPNSNDPNAIICPQLAGKILVTLGNPTNKRTVSMSAAFEHLDHMRIIGCTTFEEGGQKVIEGGADAMMVPAVYPGLFTLWRELKLEGMFAARIAPFVYGQFGEGSPYRIVVHQAATRFLHKCPPTIALEHIQSNDMAPIVARQLFSQFGRPVGYVCPDFVAMHESPETVSHTLENGDILPFLIIAKR